MVVFRTQFVNVDYEAVYNCSNTRLSFFNNNERVSF